MKAQVTVETKKYFDCPDCGLRHDSSFSHIELGRGFGPWYCDNCGTGVFGKVAGDGELTLERSPQRKLPTWVLLELYKPMENGERIFIIIEGMHWTGPNEKAIGQNDGYFYNEHACPWNYLRLPLMAVSVEGKPDTDPHGVFRHVETVMKPYGADLHGYFDDRKWSDVFSSLQEVTSDD